MGIEGRRSGRRPRDEAYVCPVCGQPVGTVIHRRKTLGIFAPVWGPGPCRDPGCPASGKPVEAVYGSEARGAHGSDVHTHDRPESVGLGDMEGLADQMGAVRPRSGRVGPREDRTECPPRQPGNEPGQPGV